ncbi:hypothetical protein TI39_contig280g00001, partial [Zymoseptoria brevis]
GEGEVNGDGIPEAKGEAISEVKGDDTPATAKSDSKGPGSHSVISVPLRILPVGDSITEGKERNGNNGWRLPLRNHLVQQGRSVDFIGTKETGDDNPDNQHEGWGGQAMVVIQEKIMANNILTQHPNLVLLGAGTNDCNEGFGLPPTEPHESEIVRLENLMDAILCENPDAALIVAQITDNLTDLKDTERVRKFNSQIPGLVEKKRKQGFRVGIVDMFNAVGYNLDDSGIHPSEKGYNAMAAAWFEAIKLLPEEWIQPAREPGSKAPAFWSQQETLACGALKGWDRDYFVTNKSQSAWMYPPKEDMNQGLFGGLLANPSFLRTFNQPDTALQGQIVSTYTLGCIFGAILSLFTGDRFGRRKNVVLGCGFIFIGGILQATAPANISPSFRMITGRIIAGFGIGVNATTIPMWQAETSRPHLRGRLVAFELTCPVGGFVLTNWINFGFTYLPDNEVSWRFPLGLQSLLALGTAGIVPFQVKSPRWLCLKGKEGEAKGAIARLYAKPVEDDEVYESLELMREATEREKEEGQVGWREALRNERQQTLRRILLGMRANVMQQMVGVNVVAYYLPVVLERSFGFSTRMSLILSACDSMQWMFWGAVAMWAMERFGRKKLMLFGAAGQSLCFAMAAIGLGVGSKAMNGVAVVFIFVYYFFLRPLVHGYQIPVPFGDQLESSSEHWRRDGDDDELGLR